MNTPSPNTGYKKSLVFCSCLFFALYLLPALPYPFPLGLIHKAVCWCVGDYELVVADVYICKFAFMSDKSLNLRRFTSLTAVRD